MLKEFILIKVIFCSFNIYLKLRLKSEYF